HLTVEPRLRVRPVPVRPAQSRAQLPYAHPAEPLHRALDAMILEVEPLADSEGRIEVRDGWFGCSVIPNETHVEVAVVGTAFAFAMARGGFPRRREVEQTIPEDALHTVSQQLLRTTQAEQLYLIGAERGYAYFGHPDRLGRDCLYLANPIRPLVQPPVVPVQREAVNGHDVHVVEYTVRIQPPEEVRIDGRHSPENDRNSRSELAHLFCREHRL